MKRKLFFLLFATSYSCWAQTQYLPFVEDGKVWYCKYEHHDGSMSPFKDPLGHGIDCIFTMHGDTLISDKDYKKVYCQFEEYYGDPKQHYYCAVREDACQVFIVEEKAKEEKLIYDFSCPGEIITITYNDYKFARTNGERRYGFLPGQWEYSVCKFSGDEVDYSNSPSWWVNGVGAPINNPFAFELTFLPFDEPKLGKNIHVVTCMADGKYIFKFDWMAEPVEPSSINDNFYRNNSIKDFISYDLQGRRLQEVPVQSIYIRDGRKYVGR